MNTIASERVRMGITQEELAKKVDKSKKTVSNWETGRRSPQATDLEKLSKLFGCSTDYLLGLTEERKTS